MNIIGIHGSLDAAGAGGWENKGTYEDTVHDAGCTLFVDGKHIRSVDEERVSRLKHDGRMPLKAIDYCLGDLTREDVDVVCFAPTGVEDCNFQMINKIYLWS